MAFDETSNNDDVDIQRSMYGRQHVSITERCLARIMRCEIERGNEDLALRIALARCFPTINASFNELSGPLNSFDGINLYGSSIGLFVFPDLAFKKSIQPGEDGYILTPNVPYVVDLREKQRNSPQFYLSPVFGDPQETIYGEFSENRRPRVLMIN